MKQSQNIKQIAFNPKYSNPAVIEKAIEKETGFKVKLDRSDMKITKLKSIEDLKALF